MCHRQGGCADNTKRASWKGKPIGSGINMAGLFLRHVSALQLIRNHLLQTVITESAWPVKLLTVP